MNLQLENKVAIITGASEVSENQLHQNYYPMDAK